MRTTLNYQSNRSERNCYGLRYSALIPVVILCIATALCFAADSEEIESRAQGLECPSTATIRTFDVQLAPGDINVGGTTWNPCGYIEIVGPDGVTNCVRWVAESRGEAFDINPVTAFSGSLVPRNLMWDSTEPYLFFEFAGGSAASGVWRVHASNSVPRYVGPTRESFRLLARSDGPDWVACKQVRDGQWLWLAYTPEDIARATHTFSTNRVDPLVAEINESRMILEGSLGIYGNQVIMYLTNTDGRVTGSYFYARHGNDLTLEGLVDPVTGRGTMTEAWDGKTTGYFDFTLSDEGMRGTWRATTDSTDLQPFAFKRLHFPDRTYSDAASKLSGFYCHVFESWIYVNGDSADALPKEQTFTAWDWLRIRHVEGDVFAFYYSVTGDNGHLGSIQGLARMTGANVAEFTAQYGLPGDPRGRLGFEFEGDSVTATELEDCSDYRGARAHFDDTLKRADEHAVQLLAETAAAP